jgi:hypothetical protein
MSFAVLVEGLESNPIVLLEPVRLAGDDLPGQLDASLDAYNAANAVRKATGALLWYDDKPHQTFEYLRDEQAVRAQRFRDTVSLTGFYICTSGRRYWHYGKCVGWVPGKRSYWEARLFHHDKKFVFDSVFASKDLLAIFSNDFYELERNARWLKSTAEAELFAAIEEWDSNRDL